MNSALTQYLEEMEDHPAFEDFPEVTIHTRNCAGETALHFAAIQGNSIIVSLLLAEGADPNLRGDHGFTPLLEAIQQGHMDVVRCLVSSGADPNIVNAWNQNAWDISEIDESQDTQEVVRRLIGDRPPSHREQGGGGNSAALRASP